MRSFSSSILALIVCGCGAEVSPRPNVVLIVIDTLRADHLGSFGYARDTSTHLDELAARSILMESAYSNAPWTKPSVGSLFTGLRPSQHRAVVESTGNHLAQSLTTLAEILADSGYATAAFTENPHISKSTSFDQGFQRLEHNRGWLADSSWVVEQASAWLAARPGAEPFFMYLHFLDPHDPYTPADADDYLVGASTEKRKVLGGNVRRLVDGVQVKQGIGPGDVEYLEALYDGEIRTTDRALGRILALLDGGGLLGETILLVTSDHGEEFLDHGTLRHGYQVYEESLHVPLVWRVPGLERARLRESVQHIDVLPTLLDLLEIAPPAHLQGHSYADLLRGGTFETGPIVAQSTWRDVAISSVRDGPWKLIVDAKSGRRELYLLSEDGEERRDLAAAEPERVVRMESLLEELLEDPEGFRVTDSEGEVDTEAEQRLRAIGYLGDG